MPILKLSGLNSASKTDLAISSNPSKSSFSSAVRLKKESTCRRGMTKLCPGEIGYPSLMIMQCWLVVTIRSAGRVQKGQVVMHQFNHKHSHKNKGVSKVRECELLCISTQGLNEDLIGYLYV
jgi:hypothetical protein